jgi:DNA polymerase sigma
LKTYLPDGDIDLTAFGGLYHEEELAAKVFAVLEREEHNLSSQFVVKDVQLIRAEVKLVKCLVQNIVVDISFNQIGGICTLCFLEKIDHLIGKDHLFKRSIILIKAWCYYESRILGAFHGLISTYALETLVLYIFHLFHSSLNGPLAVRVFSNYEGCFMF